MWKSIREFCVVCVVFFVTLTATAGFAAAEWNEYRSEKYGFIMLVLSNTTIQEKVAGPWGGLYAIDEGVEVWGMARLGEKATAEAMEKFGVELTGVAAGSWQQVSSGSGNGWEWFRTVKAMQGARSVFGGYGVGPKGSYLMLIRTTAEDFKENESDYMDWYGSIRLE
ncbi:MAG: hypothetical protein KKE17_06045 [Proteobacteria bacterium]|nr:hypothetical protein [Pseudomonadota bacterium]MBU1709549.1 hypothetical protein [Pseudomonadota bacterium]